MVIALVSFWVKFFQSFCPAPAHSLANSGSHILAVDSGVEDSVSRFSDPCEIVSWSPDPEPEWINDGVTTDPYSDWLDDVTVEFWFDWIRSDTNVEMELEVDRRTLATLTLLLGRWARFPSDSFWRPNRSWGSDFVSLRAHGSWSVLLNRSSAIRGRFRTDQAIICKKNVA